MVLIRYIYWAYFEYLRTIIYSILTALIILTAFVLGPGELIFVQVFS